MPTSGNALALDLDQAVRIFHKLVPTQGLNALQGKPSPNPFLGSTAL